MSDGKRMVSSRRGHKRCLLETLRKRKTHVDDCMGRILTVFPANLKRKCSTLTLLRWYDVLRFPNICVFEEHGIYFDHGPFLQNLKLVQLLFVDVVSLIRRFTFPKRVCLKTKAFWGSRRRFVSGIANVCRPQNVSPPPLTPPRKMSFQPKPPTRWKIIQNWEIRLSSLFYTKPGLTFFQASLFCSQDILIMTEMKISNKNDQDCGICASCCRERTNVTFYLLHQADCQLSKKLQRHILPVLPWHPICSSHTRRHFFMITWRHEKIKSALERF